MGFFSKPFLQYPSMERQDLTQSQLGSFKFTPVDAVRKEINQDYLTALAHEEMLGLLQYSAQSAVAGASETPSSASFDSAISSAANLAAYNNLRMPHTDSFFFNKHIKPDLEDSRLRYGPAALRSAVESHSPEKTRTQFPRFVTSHPPQPEFADMNPIASTFVPRGPPANLSYEDATTALHALARSLASEQHAHHDTQLVLGSVHTRIAELEASLEEISKQNKQLLSKVNMMGSIIKHNQHKARTEEWTPVKPETPRSLDQGSPIIHDVLAKRLADKAECGGSETQSNSSVQVNDTQPELNDSVVFNIDSIKNSDDITIRQQFDSPRSLGDSKNGTPRPARQYYDSSEEVQTGRFSPVVTPLKEVDDKLISFSPDELGNGKESNAVIAISARLQQGISAIPAQQDTVAMSTTSTSPPRDKLLNLRLQLPPKFLAKYKAPSKVLMPAELSAKAETPNIARADVPQRNGVSMSTLIGTSPPAPVLVPEAAIHARYVVDLPEPFDLTIGWRINKDNPIWEDEREKTIALGRQTLEVNRKNAFWKHPVRYIDYADKNIFRTVMVDFIPLGTKFKDVLNEILVPGGSLEQIELFPPIGDATNFMTARVVFNYEVSASTFVTNARKFGMKIMGQDVRVYQLLTQTWPKNRDLDEAVFERGFTRLLVLNNASNQQIASVPRKLEVLVKWIVQYGKTHDGLPVIEFTSVAMASKALSQLLEDPDLGGIEFDFETDPCAEPESDTV